MIKFNRDLLYQIMYRRKFTPDMLAEELNISEVKVNRWLDGRLIPTVKEIKTLNDFFGKNFTIISRDQSKEITLC